MKMFIVAVVTVITLLVSYLIWFSLWDFIFHHHYIQCKVTEITWSRGSLFTKVVQLSSVTQLCLTVCDPMDCSTPDSLSITNSRSLFKLLSIESMMPSHHLIPCLPLLLLPSIFHRIRIFSNESAFPIRWPKYWSFSFSISPSDEYSGLISFQIDLFDLLTVQGTLKNLLQHHSSKASILWCSAFFMVQLSHPYMTVGKTTALTTQPFVCYEPVTIIPVHLQQLSWKWWEWKW